MGKYTDYLDIQEEVKAALEEHRGVVALESPIISHGMPYPQNVEMAKNCERIIRKAGAVPATIAIIDGRIKIGLSQEDLQRLASSDTVMKVSRRDLAVAVAERRMGATTVATTMMCAAMAGIQFFVTGGVGGVHRGYEETMDVSADLEELGQSDVTVICAGAKSILDIPRTLEYLETKGVTVIGYQSDTLPEFFTREGSCRLQQRMDTVEEIAHMLHVKKDLGIKGGVLVANPIPEAYSMDAAYINAMIKEALESAKAQNIKGKDTTPYLLAHIVKATQGKSLAANIQLVYHNAEVGAALANAYAVKE